MLTVQISDRELGIYGFTSGDSDPGATQEGLLTKLRLADDQNQAAIQATYTIQKNHDHTVNGRQLGSIISGSTRADSFENNTFTNAKLGALSVTGSATAIGAIQANHIQNASIPKTKLGSAIVSAVLVATDSPGSFVHGLGRYPIFCLVSESENHGIGYIAISSVTTSQINFVRKGSAPLSSIAFRVIYR